MRRLFGTPWLAGAVAAVLLGVGFAPPARAQTLAGGTATQEVNDGRDREAELISFIESPTATCYHSGRANDICHVTWESLSVSAADSLYIISMTVTIDSRLRAMHRGFFQNAMVVPAMMYDEGFEVACGEPGAGGDPDFGNSYSYVIRAEESSGASATNMGSVLCPPRLAAPGISSIEVVKTVGTDPAVCAVTDEITVAAGTEVYYCYAVTNTGDVTLNYHNLTDSELGDILTGFNYVLAPGDSIDTVAAGLTFAAIITADTTNTASWEACNAGPTDQATAQASATVFVLQPVTVTVLVGTPGGGTVTGGGSYTVGDWATVEAFPSPGWVFLHWVVGGNEVTDNPYTFEVEGDTTLTAVFQRQLGEPIPATGTAGLVLIAGLLLGAAILVLRRLS